MTTRIAIHDCPPDVWDRLGLKIERSEIGVWKRLDTPTTAIILFEPREAEEAGRHQTARPGGAA